MDSHFEPNTDEELKQIAKDTIAGLIFTSDQIGPHGDLGMVFMPLILMDEEAKKKLLKMEPDMVYEYYKEAAPMGCNGYPCFPSCRILNKEDSAKVREYIKKIQEAIDAV